MGPCTNNLATYPALARRSAQGPSPDYLSRQPRHQRARCLHSLARTTTSLGGEEATSFWRGGCPLSLSFFRRSKPFRNGPLTTSPASTHSLHPH